MGNSIAVGMNPVDRGPGFRGTPLMVSFVVAGLILLYAALRFSRSCRTHRHRADDFTSRRR